MSFTVSRLVRKARLPRGMKRRALAKAVLLTLADRGDDNGCNAFPSIMTIAAEVECAARIVPSILASLVDAKLIGAQRPPGQHRPRTWRIYLGEVSALIPRVGVQHVAALGDAAAQHGAELEPPGDPATHDPADLNPLTTSGQQIVSSGRQIDAPARHIDVPARHDRADDPILNSFNDPLNGAGADAPRTSTPTPQYINELRAQIRPRRDPVESHGRRRDRKAKLA